MTAAFAASGLVHVYREAGTDVAALKGVDLVVPEGARVALLGPSGSGKSTLLSIASGLVRPSAGRVEVLGRDVGTLPERGLRRLRGEIGLLLQGAASNLLLHESAVGNVVWATRGRAGADARVGDRLLAEHGLDDDRRPVGTLSPADQQIVSIAVVMAAAPRLLLADEPTSRLGDAARDRVLDLLVRAAAAAGTAVLLVTHDEAVAARMDRMIHLRDGRVGEEATAAGRFAVIGADGSVPIPEPLRARWPAGSLVAVEETEDGELRVRRADER